MTMHGDTSGRNGRDRRGPGAAGRLALDPAKVTAEAARPPRASRDAFTIEQAGAIESPREFRLSPDGRRVAYTAEAAGARQIFLLPIRGGTAEQLTATEKPATDPQWSPDGRRIVFVRDDAIWMVEVEGSRQVLVTQHPAGNRSPRWCADGHRIAFISRRRGWDQLWVVDAPVPRRGRPAARPRSPEPRALTPAGLDVDDFAWSPDGRQIAVTSQRLPDLLTSQIHTVDVATGEQHLIAGETAWETGPRWLRDGSGLLMISDADAWFQVIRISKDGADRTVLTFGTHDHGEPGGGWGYLPLPSPDGTRFVYPEIHDGLVDLLVGVLPRIDEASNGHVKSAVEIVAAGNGSNGSAGFEGAGGSGESGVSAGSGVTNGANGNGANGHGGGGAHEAGADVGPDDPAGSIEVAQDDADLAGFAGPGPVRSYEASGDLIGLDVTGEAVARPTSSRRSAVVNPFEGVWMAVDWMPDSSAVLAIGKSDRAPEDLWLLPVPDAAAEGARPRQLTHSLPLAVDTSHFAGGSRISFGARDGTRIEGTLYLPPSAQGDAATRVPCVVHSHGGPTAQAFRDWMPFRQLVVEAGMAFLSVDFRGSTGYGRDFRWANRGEWGHADAFDVIDAARWAAEQDWCDGRLGHYGWSYGGYMTLCVLVEDPSLWRAGVDLYGDSNIAESYRHCDRVGRIDLERMMGRPDDPSAADAYRRGSPLHRAERIEAPLLILHGRRDKRVMPLATEQMVEALEIEGKHFQVHWYDEEAHGWQKRDNRRDAWRRCLEFLKRHLLEQVEAD